MSRNAPVLHTDVVVKFPTYSSEIAGTLIIKALCHVLYIRKYTPCPVDDIFRVLEEREEAGLSNSSTGAHPRSLRPSERKVVQFGEHMSALASSLSTLCRSHTVTEASFLFGSNIPSHRFRFTLSLHALRVLNPSGEAGEREEVDGACRRLLRQLIVHGQDLAVDQRLSAVTVLVRAAPGLAVDGTGFRPRPDLSLRPHPRTSTYTVSCTPSNTAVAAAAAASGGGGGGGVQGDGEEGDVSIWYQFKTALKPLKQSDIPTV